MQVTLAFLIVFVATGGAANEPVKFTLIVPEGPVSARLASSVTLPCAVSPTFSVATVKMRWHRPEQFKTPVLLYENKNIQQDPSGTGYRGRVSLVGSLEQGNVSIKLENIKLADKGLYVCFVQSKVWFEDANVTLNVEAIGTSPLLSLSQGDNGQVRVSCTSDGWSPQPVLTWTSGGGETINAVNTVYATDGQGLVSVSSWLLHPPSQNESVSCSVGLSDQERREGRVVPFIYTSDKGAVIGGIIGGVVFLILVILIPTAVLLYRKGSQGKRGKKGEGSQGKKGKKGEVKENEKLMGEKEDALTELQNQTKTTTTKLEQNEDALTVQKQMETTATRLKRNEDALKKLRTKILKTLNSQVGDARVPLNELLKDLNKLETENREQMEDMKELKKEMIKVKMKQKPEDIEEMALLQQKLEKINNSVSDWEKKVEELQIQVAEKTKGLNKGKALEETLPKLGENLAADREMVEQVQIK